MPSATPRLGVLAAALTAAAVPAAAIEIAGAHFDEHMQIEASDVVLNGAGLRRMLFFKAYAIGVYVPHRHGALGELVSEPGPKRIRVIALRDLTAEQIADSIIPILHKNSSERELEILATRIAQLRDTVRSIEAARIGAVIHLDWLPSLGATRLTVNGIRHGADIPGEDFFNALLKVWLGDNVNDRPLREKLLGKEPAL